MGSSDADRDWLRRDNTVLMQVHGASVLGLGLVAISAAQFEYADPRYNFFLLFLGSAVAYSNDLRNRVMCARRNMIAKCMLGLHILLSYALLQDWKPVYTTRALLCQDSPICVSKADSRRIVFQGGQTPTPVMLAIGVLSFLYSLCCAAFPDSDPPTITSPRSKLNHDKKTI